MQKGGHRGRDCMVVGFTTTCVISAFCDFKPRSWRDVLDTTLCDKVCDRSVGFSRVLRFPTPIKLTAMI